MAGGEMNLLKQAQMMNSRIQEVQAELKERIEEGTAGGGAVKVFMNGQRQIMGVKIDPDAVDPEDVETLEELVETAVKIALEKAHELEQREMNKITGGLNLPGLNF
jgi:nucleoid-associated protein EbfC